MQGAQLQRQFHHVGPGDGTGKRLVEEYTGGKDAGVQHDIGGLFPGTLALQEIFDQVLPRAPRYAVFQLVRQHQVGGWL